MRDGPPANTSCQFFSSHSKKVRLVDQPVFGDFGIAGAEFALGKRVQHIGVGEHEIRLMEDADQVLAMARIDAGLAADRGIDLRQ
jgi:hypothetical protein